VDKFFAVIENISEWLWNYPMLLLIAGGGVFLSFRLKFVQIRYFPYIMRQTFGKIFNRGLGEGSVSPFQAAATALASSIGASNIVGVPVAIAFGGPGAIFWMWMIFIAGGATKFSEIVLGVYFREKNPEGQYVGGPMYYISKGFPIRSWGKFLAKISVICDMFIVFPAITIESISLVQNAEAIGVNNYFTGVVLMVIVGAVVFGGLIRIAKVVDKMVPFMGLLYVIGSLVVVFSHAENILPSFALIFKSAFSDTAAVGGFAGAGVGMALRWGIARGTYTCEAGMGTAPIAHSAANTDHPVRQGFWGIFEITVSGLIICTMTALVVMTSGVWQSIAPEDAASMPSVAFQQILGERIGGGIVTLALSLFVLSTVIVIIFYIEKEVEFLLGTKASKFSRAVYICAIMLGATGGIEILFSFLDLFNAFVVAPNMICVLALSPLVVKLTEEFFAGEKYYLKDKRDLK
jgi:AGCS family alanine or glycine:cation symporter